MGFYENVKQICDSRGYTLNKLCHLCGFNESAATYWKKGTIPKIDAVEIIANVLNVTTDYLIRGINSESSLSENEQELLKFYRVYKDEVGEDEALREFKDVLPHKKIEYYQDKVSAGAGIDVETPAAKKRTVYGSDIVYKADFAVMVEGESMSPKFHDGDILLVRSIENTRIEIGDIGIFIVDGQTAFVKELGENELISLNSKYDNIEFADHNDFICKGVVLGTAVLID